MTLERQVLNLINEKYPPYSDETDFIINNFGTDPAVAVQVKILLKKLIKDGYVSNSISFDLTTKGRNHLAQLSGKSIDHKMAFASICISVAALLISLASFIAGVLK